LSPGRQSKARIRKCDAENSALRVSDGGSLISTPLPGENGGGKGPSRPLVAAAKKNTRGSMPRGLRSCHRVVLSPSCRRRSLVVLLLRLFLVFLVRLLFLLRFVSFR